MNFRRLFLAPGILGLLALFSLFSLPVPAQQGNEELVPLRLTTNPAEATVNIDDAYAGETGPKQAFPVAPGPHEVVVYKEGFLVEVRSVDVRAGEPADLSIELAPDVAIPYGLSLARAPKFVQSEGDGMRTLVEVLDLVTEFHVSDPDGGDLMAHAFETVVGTLDAIRRRESLLAARYEPAVRERFYGKEIDLSAYPELGVTRADTGPDVRFEVVAGRSRSTFSAPKTAPHRFALEFRGLRRWILENWDSRALVSEDAFYFFAIQAVLGRLDDPFTYFLSPRAVAEMKIDTTQQLGGLGMQ
ncbi:MAG: PEGA domain-containing protein, partial [Planctomycetes bacterium]|nr:PEGA domain-containing protein [Planctomycetota bacterium]